MSARFVLFVSLFVVAYCVTEDGSSGGVSSGGGQSGVGLTDGLRKIANSFKSDTVEESPSSHRQLNTQETTGVENHGESRVQGSGQQIGSSNNFGSQNTHTDNLHSSNRPSGSSSGGFNNENIQSSGSSSGIHGNLNNQEFSGRPSGSSGGFGSDNLNNQGLASSGRPSGSSGIQGSGSFNNQELSGRPSGSSSGFGSENLNNQGLASSGRPGSSSGIHGSDNLNNQEFSGRPSTSSGIHGSSNLNNQEFSGRPSTSSGSFGNENLNNQGSTSSGRPGSSSGIHGSDNFNNQEFSGRPSGSSGGFGSQNNENLHSSGRPVGSSSGFGNENVGNSQGISSSGRPVDSSAGFGNENVHSSGNPSGSYGNENVNNQGVHSSGRPDSETSLTSNTNDNDHQSSGLKPSNSGDDSVQTVSNNQNGKEEEEQKEICFAQLGCFSLEEPWKSALRPVKKPLSPQEIQTTLLFYSRENIEREKKITLYPEVNMGGVRFDPSRITVFIVHGFANSGEATWMRDMKNAYLKQVDANVMLVDWGKGAQIFSYLQVTGNTRVVGKQLGLFVKYLQKKYRADPGKFHLIGHSLGAHICSYLAKDVPGIARLTALDPAQPAFEGFSKEVRLDKSDAEFVDVIHTDARPFLPFLGFGMIAPHGHVDFYMNGGFDQPGCIAPAKKDLPSIKSVLDLAKYPVERIGKAVACPHGRAYEFLTEAFNETEKCIFWGHKADVSNVLKSVTNTITQGTLKKFIALSSNCSKEDCTPVGFATKKSPLRGSFVVTTGARTPYCISEPGVPAETPREHKRESFIQKINPKRVFG